MLMTLLLNPEQNRSIVWRDKAEQQQFLERLSLGCIEFTQGRGWGAELQAGSSMPGLHLPLP